MIELPEAASPKIPDLERIGSLIAPTSIVVIGASGKKTATGNHVIRNLLDASFAGEIHVVHPTADLIEGIIPKDSIQSLPREVDLALVTIPARGVLDTLKELEGVGCRAAIVPAVGIDAKDRAGIEELAARSSMAICGPNTMGLVNAADNIPMTFWPGILAGVRPGGVALIAQSGSASVAVTRSCQTAGFSRIIPSGNEWITTTPDYLDWLAEDPATHSVGLVIESISDVQRFTDAAARMRERDKRMVVLHVGSSATGAEATRAHTGALVGQPEAYKAFFADLDIPVVADYDELASVLDAFSCTEAPRAKGDRIAVMAFSGGLAALSADVASRVGANMASLSDQTKLGLLELLPGAVAQNPYDAGASTAYSPDTFAKALACVARDEGVDSILTIVEAQATLNEPEREDSKADLEAVVAATAESDCPIIVTSSSSLSIHAEMLAATSGSRVPFMRGIENALVVLKALGMNERGIGTRASEPAGDELGALGEAKEFLQDHSEDLPADLARYLLSSYGIPVVKSEMATDAGEARQVARNLGYPVVAKVASAQVPHRSEAGGVVVDIQNEEALTEAIERIETNVLEYCPEAQITGYEIQRFRPSRIEAIVGAVTDPVFGPTVVVGLGGVLVELVKDSAFSRAPIDAAQALKLIQKTRLAEVAGGYRGLAKPTDLGPLADLVAKFSTLAVDLQNEMGEGDLNPVLIEEGTGRVLVADYLIVGRD